MLIFRGVKSNSIFKYVCNIYTVRPHLPRQLYQLALCDSVCVCVIDQSLSAKPVELRQGHTMSSPQLGDLPGCGVIQ